jgi:hypothetical protein
MKRHNSTGLKGSGMRECRIDLPYPRWALVEASSDGNELGVQ